MKRLLVVLGAVLVLTGCGTTTQTTSDSTSVQIDTKAATLMYLDYLLDWATRWDDANALANNTSRIALAGPVGRLQELRYELMISVAPTPETERLRDMYVEGANKTLESYLAFMADEPDGTVGLLIRQANTLYDSALDYYGTLYAWAAPTS